MKRIRSYENYRIKSKREQIIKEAVLQVNDIYKVKTMVDIPQSLINRYVKKVKDETGNDLRQFFGDVDIAEEVVKYINMNNLDIDKLPAGVLMGGGQEQAQMQTQMQTQTQMQDDVQMQDQPQAQVQMEEPQSQAQTQGEEGQSQFEDPQSQVQTQGEEGQVQVQVQTQGEEGQVQVQGQAQDEEEGEDEEELPL